MQVWAQVKKFLLELILKIVEQLIELSHFLSGVLTVLLDLAIYAINLNFESYL